MFFRYLDNQVCQENKVAQVDEVYKRDKIDHIILIKSSLQSRQNIVIVHIFAAFPMGNL